MPSCLSERRELGRDMSLQRALMADTSTREEVAPPNQREIATIRR